MLICDKRRAAHARGQPTSGPPRGPTKSSPPASGPRLRRSPAWGGTPPTPGLRPPGARSSSRRGFRHGCDGGGVATACGCPCPTPSPWRFSGFWRNSAWAVPWHGGGSGRAPCQGGGWATRPRRWAARVQPLAAVPAVHGLGEVVHGRPGYRAHLFGRALEKTGVFLGEPRKLYFRGCGSESALRVFNWKLIS